MSSKIRTYTGAWIDPLNPTLQDIYIKDIAHALSNICRFTGHCKSFYSVAQHSVLCTNRVNTRRMQQIMLLHDGSEAYLMDIARPVKQSDGFAKYREIEQVLQDAVFSRFNLLPLTQDEKELMHIVDIEQFEQEQKHIMFPFQLELDTLVAGFSTWDPSKAEQRFLSSFLDLF